MIIHRNWSSAAPTVRLSAFTAKFHHIYFIRPYDCNFVKVGRTRNLQRRMEQLKYTREWKNLLLIACVPSLHPEAEQVFHRLLAGFHVSPGREIFKCEDLDVLDAVKLWLSDEANLLSAYRLRKPLPQITPSSESIKIRERYARCDEVRAAHNLNQEIPEGILSAP